MLMIDAKKESALFEKPIMGVKKKKKRYQGVNSIDYCQQLEAEEC